MGFDGIQDDGLLNHIAIIGAGPLGRWLALEAAHAGFRVVLEDVMPGNLRRAEEEWGDELGEILLASTIEDAVREADLAIDCVPDELESKLEIFCLLDRMAPPRTVLMTPTTRLSIADLAACTYRAEKCVAIAAEAAELAKSTRRDMLLRTTSRTAPATIETAREFWERLRFAVRIERDPSEECGGWGNPVR